MSRIDDLLKQLAPEGVQYRPLGEVATFRRGSVITKKDTIEGAIPVIAGGRTPAYFHAESNRDGQSITVAGSGAYAGFVGFWDRPIFVSDAFTVHPDEAMLESKFVYYFLTSKQSEIHDKRQGGGVPHVHSKDLAPLRIPVPPLTVQAEIVRVLDHFTELEAELKAELKARRHQYAFYRDLLLSHDDADCEWLTLPEVSREFGRGKSKHRPRNDPKLYGGTYPFIQTGDIRNSGHLITEYSQTYNEAGLAQSKLWPRGTVCITIAANVAETGILDFEACFPDSVIGMIVNPAKTSQHFVEYLLQSLKVNLAAKGQGSAQANINLATFENERFPFPPLRVQERIVGILDKFNALVDDSSVGLPAELAARRRQYRYYRDRLLTFKEVAA